MANINTADQVKVGNTKKVEPSMADLMQVVMKQVKLDLNCHAVATIKSFNPANQTVTCTINYKKVMIKNDPDGDFKAELRDYPLLVGVPLIIYGAGIANITLPSAQIVGASCVLMFNDRDMDNWAVSGQVTAPATERLHALTDAIALLCVRPSGAPISNYDEERLAIFNGTTKIGLGELLVLITNSNGKSLGDVLTDLNTALSDLVTLLTTTFAANTASPGSPLNAAFAAAVAPITADIATVQTEIEGLLE